jgi:polysaccharide biosynthesis protein PslG
VVHKFERPGTYTVRVEVTDNWGHKAVSSGRGSPPEEPAPQPAQPTRLQPQITAAPQAGPMPDAVAFPATRQVLQGRFLEYWRANGGLAVFGMPIGSQVGEPLAQQFERNRFEYHAENKAPYDVLLGRLGAEALERSGRDWRAFPTVDSAAAGCRYFAETRHSLCGAFKAYWERHGLEFDGRKGSSYAESLALFGLPLSEPQIELVEGKPTLVQWFERARFEHHPENAAPYDVLLGRLGAEGGGITR